MRTYAEYLNTMTVKELREIAARMEIHGRSSMTKPKLIEAVDYMIGFWHGSALSADAKRTQDHIDRARNLAISKQATEDTFTQEIHGKPITWTGAAADLMRRHFRRFDGYLAQRGSLTPRQRRRVAKKARAMGARAEFLTGRTAS